jgi:hypothetical protein
MPLVRTALMATAACLIGATAYAQTDNSSQAPQQPAPQSSMPADQGASMPADQGASMPADASAPTGGAANASATVGANGDQVIASQPVPDTRANRAAYGQPMSRAGKRTAPKGN